MARDFTGDTDAIKYTLATGQNNLGTVSTALWTYIDTVSNFDDLFLKGTSFTNLDWQLNLEAAGTLVWFVSGSTTDGVWKIANPSTGTWHHICVTYDFGAVSNDPIFYIDGTATALTSDQNPVGTLSNASTRFAISNTDTSGAGSNFDGRLAEFGMWNRILLATEAASLAKGFSPLHLPTGLVFYTPLNRNVNDLMMATSGSITGTAVINHPRIIYPIGLQNSMFPGVAAAATAVKDLIQSGIIAFAR